MNLRKAFDCLVFSTLGIILHNLGIRGLAHKLMLRYLSGRKQFVACDGAASNLGNIIAGISQGSVLGHLLFLLYINGIFSLKLNGYSQLYADDMALVYGESQFPLLKKSMTEDINILVPWLSNINFSINFSKTKFFIFRGSKTNPANAFNCITHGNNTIHSTSEYDYLGLTIDQRMNWSSHISKVSRKISSSVYRLKMVRHPINSSSLKLIYSAYIKSHLTYLLPFWGSASNVHIKCLQVLQNKAIKYMRFLLFDTHSQSPYDGTKFLSMHQLYAYKSIFLLHKMRWNLIKCNFPLLTNLCVTGRSTRSSSLLRVPNFLTTNAQRTVFYEGIQLYNTLPDNIKALNAISEFKNALKAHVSATIPII